MTTRIFSMKIGVCHSLGAENPIKSNRERVQLYIVSVMNPPPHLTKHKQPTFKHTKESNKNKKKKKKKKK